MGNEVIDLEMDKDGAYAPKNVVNKKDKIKQKVIKSIQRSNQNHVDDFLHGIDLGLDFIDKVVPRVKRIVKLRG